MIAGRAAELDTASPALWMLLILPAMTIIVAIVLAAIAAAVDLVQSQRQDFCHWVGLIALAALVAHPTMALSLLWYY
jgi:type III secretory pathway component EscS